MVNHGEICAGWLPCCGPVLNSKPLMPIKQQVDPLRSNLAALSGLCNFSPHRILGVLGEGGYEQKSSQWLPLVCQALVNFMCDITFSSQNSLRRRYYYFSHISY